ncbi:zinc finger protein 710-like isoform X2 [Syngnathoides biaculeatus]|uniref:zinc finger protein 710-like isoform X2 n=1 Tax=Syngnathoides biaculeatus TaxID=300417 RepID=UPI002ADE6E9E|nr:zinc finger protein 710-like isoform X2 [Syngnathoides biaculeatus]
MRSLKHLKHHARNNADESCRAVRNYLKVTEGQMDVGTQTEPVVVLSLAQAAVLGLISQNEIFGATIAPNGFYTGEPKEGPPPPPEAMEYEYADQLIGANGDYLPEPAGGPASRLSPGERRRPIPYGPRTKRTRSDRELLAYPSKVSSPQAQVKGELIECPTSPACIHMNIRCMAAKQGDHVANQKTSLPDQACKNCPSCVRETSLPQQGGPLGQKQEESVNSNRKEEESLVEEEPEEEALNLKTGGDTAEPLDNKYFQSNEAAYEPAGMALPGDYEDNGQAMLWSDPEGLARRMQIDRLDINVQIDESYCVDVGEGLKRWKCRMCEKSYTSKYNLVTHILGHNGIKPHECNHCGKLFKQPSHLQTHLLTHQGTRPHKCTVCEKAFTQTSHLKRHMLQHTDVKPYSCRFCGRGFAYPSELRTHESKHENGQCHVCTHCGMEFPTYAHLKRHLSSHQGPATYQCTECHKSFAYRSQLQNHLMKHQNVRPYVCPECGMEFVQIHHLRQHALTHKGMKEFKCEVCSREFTLSANLKRHMLIHASVRPFQCHVCFKTFVQKQTLKTHMIVHLPVKPFKCKVCGKSFNRMYNLLGHMHLHAGSKPFKCPYCSSKFNLKGNLSRHMKVKHGIVDGTTEGHEPPQDTEGPEEYQEESFEFSERENRASNNNANNTPDISKLSPMEYYSAYGKGAARCSAT